MTSEFLSKAPEMSPATKEILSRARQMVPPMLEKFHKGQLGRVGVLGGSEDYTGAPYFSAMSSARLGCDMVRLLRAIYTSSPPPPLPLNPRSTTTYKDLQDADRNAITPQSHVICTPAAASVIKTYSPNLMVHPLMRQSSNNNPATSSSDDPAKPEDTDADAVSSRIIDMLPRLHVLVIGPGLGRDPLMQATVARVIAAARKRSTPLVLDADALQVVQKHPDLVRGYELAVLTPNVVEFGRLCEAFGVDAEDQVEVEVAGGNGNGNGNDGDSKETRKVETLARALDGPTIVQKGGKDYISNGKVTLTVDLAGGLKRSGGQGDTLTGAIGTFLAWRKAYLDGLWDHGGKLEEKETLGLAAFAGAAITRECSRLAFKKKGRSLQASDLTDEVHNSFLNLFGEYDPDAETSKL